MTTGNSLQNTMHLYYRAGFGCSYADAEKTAHHSIEKMVKNHFKNATANKPITAAQFTYPENFKSLTGDEKKAVQKEKDQQKQNLNVTWLTRFSDPETALRERLTLFWHGHLACRVDNPMQMQELNNIQRNFALENFKDLLLAVSKSAAMLDFLNNQQNKKNHPNENFAREVMELFTIGRGNYSENDIRESARAYTGWQHDKDFKFTFNVKNHDASPKTFMGQKGNFTGEDIIDILLSKPATARFLATKIYTYLVNDVPDQQQITDLADIYYKSSYHTGELVKHILSSDWFYSAQNTGNKIKSPVEFIAILNKTFNISYTDPKSLFYLQQLLGQTLFNPPNVSGWAGGKAWIDTSSLLFRMKIPSVILSSGLIEFQGKHDPEEEALIALQKKTPSAIQKRMSSVVDWSAILNSFPESISQSDLITYLLPAGMSETQRRSMLSTDRADLKGVIVELISTPEYQLS